MTQGLEQDWSDLLYNSTDDGTLVGTSPTPPPPPPPPDLPPPTPQTRESAVSGMEESSLSDLVQFMKGKQTVSAELYIPECCVEELKEKTSQETNYEAE